MKRMMNLDLFRVSTINRVDYMTNELETLVSQKIAERSEAQKNKLRVKSKKEIGNIDAKLRFTFFSSQPFHDFFMIEASRQNIYNLVFDMNFRFIIFA